MWSSSISFIAISGLLLTVTAMAAIAIAAIVWRRDSEIKRDLFFRLSLMHLLSNSRTTEEAALQSLSACGEHLGFSAGSFWLAQEDHMLKNTAVWRSSNLLSYGFLPDVETAPLPPGEYLAGAVAWSRAQRTVENLESVDLKGVNLDGVDLKGVQLDGVNLDEDKLSVRMRHAADNGMRSAFAFPLMSGDRCIGVLEFFSTDRKSIGIRRQTLVKWIGESIALTMIRLSKEAQIAEQGRLSTFIAEVSDVLTKSIPIDQMLRACTDSMVRHLDAAFARIWVLDEEEQVLELICSSGMYTHTDGNHKRVPVGRFKIGLIAQERLPHLTNDVLNDSRISSPQWAKEEGMVAFAGHPLIVQDKVVGVMAMFSKQPLSEKTLFALSCVANGIALGIKRLRAEEQALDSENLFRQLAENVRDVFFVIKEGPTVAYVSPAYEEQWGRSRDAVLDNPSAILEHVHKDDRGKVKKLIDTTNPVEIRDGIEFRIAHPDGTVRWALMRVFPKFDADGKWTATFGIANDITERKENEKRVNEFYSTVSHELRTPLTSIHASLRLMEGGLAGKLPEKSASLVNIARVESSRLIRLINDILDLRKLEAGKVELRKSIVKSSQLTDMSTQAVQSMAREAQVTVRTDSECDGAIFCDQDRMIQVLENLLANAIKFSSKGDSVILRVKHDGKNIRFEVVDHGPGIPRSQMSKLFEKFQQLDASDSRAKGGTGLGLSITKAIVEQHGGRIGVDSEYGQGSTFWVEIPLVAGPNEEEEQLITNSHKVWVLSKDKHLLGLMDGESEFSGVSCSKAETLAELKRLASEMTPNAVFIDAETIATDDIDWVTKNLKTQLTLFCDQPESQRNGARRMRKPVDRKQLELAFHLGVRDTSEPTKILVVEDDTATRELIRHQVAHLPVVVLEAGDGCSGLQVAAEQHPDLIILDIGLPQINGFELIERLRDSELNATPLVVYTCLELDHAQRQLLTLGPSRHLVKSKAPEQMLVESVKQLLDGLVEETGDAVKLLIPV